MEAAERNGANEVEVLAIRDTGLVRALRDVALAGIWLEGDYQR